MIGEALRLIRVFHNLNQAALAMALGLEESEIAEVESGSRPPSAELIAKYASEFDIDRQSIHLLAGRLEQVANGVQVGRPFVSIFDIPIRYSSHSMREQLLFKQSIYTSEPRAA